MVLDKLPLTPFFQDPTHENLTKNYQYDEPLEGMVLSLDSEALRRGSTLFSNNCTQVRNLTLFQNLIHQLQRNLFDF